MQELLSVEGSRWQKYAPIGFALVLKDAAIQGLPLNVQPAAVSTAPSAVFAAQWDVSNKPLFMTEILEKTDQPNMTLDEFTVVFTGKEITFTAKGKIYVRKS